MRAIDLAPPGLEGRSSSLYIDYRATENLAHFYGLKNIYEQRLQFTYFGKTSGASKPSTNECFLHLLD